MTRLANLFNARRLVQGAATVLTVTLALAVRVEHSCSEESKPRVSAYPALLYAFSSWVRSSLASRRTVLLRTSRNSGTTRSETFYIEGVSGPRAPMTRHS